MTTPNSAARAAEQDGIIQRLRDNADIDEAEHGNARVVQLEREAADEIERLRRERSALRAPVAGEAKHPDDAAVDRFAAAMKAKLAKKRAEGHYGWQNTSHITLSSLLSYRAALSATQSEQGERDADKA